MCACKMYQHRDFVRKTFDSVNIQWESDEVVSSVHEGFAKNNNYDPDPDH